MSQSASCAKICVICSDVLELQLACLSCGHTFHFDCIEKWFKTKVECPICRKKTTRQSVRKLFFSEDANVTDEVVGTEYVEEGRDEVLCLKNQLDEAKSAMEVLQRDLATKTAELEQTKQNYLGLMLPQAYEKDDEKKGYERRIEMLKLHCIAQKTKIDEVRAQLDRNEEWLDESNEKIKELDTIKMNHACELHSLNTVIEQQRHSIGCLAEKAAGLQSQLAQYKAKFDYADGKVANLETLLARKTDWGIKLRKTCKENHELAQKMEARVEELMRKLNVTTAELKEARINDYEKAAHERKEELAKLKAELSKALAKAKELEGNHANEKQKLNKVIEEQHYSIGCSALKAANLRGQVTNYKVKLNFANQEIADLNAALSSEKTQWNMQINAYQKNQDLVQKLEIRVQDLIRKLNHTKNELEDSRKLQNIDAGNELESLKKVIQDQRFSVDIATKNARDLEDKLASCMTKLEAANGKIFDFEACLEYEIKRGDVSREKCREKVALAQELELRVQDLNNRLKHTTAKLKEAQVARGMLEIDQEFIRLVDVCPIPAKKRKIDLSVAENNLPNGSDACSESGNILVEQSTQTESERNEEDGEFEQIRKELEYEKQMLRVELTNLIESNNQLEGSNDDLKKQIEANQTAAVIIQQFLMGEFTKKHDELEAFKNASRNNGIQE